MYKKFKHTYLPFLLNRYKQGILAALSFLIVSETFLTKDNSDVRVFMVLGLYIACMVYFKLKSNFTFFLSLVTLGCMYIQFIVSKASVGTEKAAVLLFFFMLIGIIQQFREK